MQDGIKFEMEFPDLSIGFDAKMTGQGSDANGDFTISGEMKVDRVFHFDKFYETYKVCYKGTVEGHTLKGTWSLPEQPEDEFEITLNSEHWIGFFEQDGEKAEMDLAVCISDGGVFGVGKDDIGTFVIRGFKTEFDFIFIKKYILPWIEAHHKRYYGKHGQEDGIAIVRGRWGIEDQTKGTFELIAEQPS